MPAEPNLTISLVVFWLTAQAPSSDAAAPARFAEEIVVTAERGAEPRAETAAAVSVLTRDEIARLPAENLAELLDEMPGFQVLFPEGFGLMPMVSTRGFFGGGEAEYVQLLVDGVPVGDVESGLADWRRIRAGDVERVEALRGPGSSAYGDTALGGVVQVFRRTTAHAPVKEIAFSGAGFGSWSGDAVYRGGDALRFGLTGSASRTNGFRAHSAGEEAAGDLSVGSTQGGHHWSLTVSGSGRDRQEPGPLSAEQLARDRLASDPLFRFDREQARRGRAALSFRRDGGAFPFRAVVHGAVREVEFLRTLLLAPSVGDRAHRHVSTESAGGSWEAEKTFRAKGREHGLRAGLDISRDWLDTDYSSADEQGRRGARTAEAKGRRDRFGVFVSSDWRASKRLRLAAGLRWDTVMDDAQGHARSRTKSRAWSPRAGATVRLGSLAGSPVSAFAQVSRAFKAPTIDQLIDPRPFPDFRGGSFRISNPDLSPQRAGTMEAGLSQRMSSGRWEAVVYRTAVEDEIDFDPATFRYRNIGRSLHRGLEVSVRVLESKTISPHADYAWTRVEATQEGRRGFQLKNLPEHLLRAGIRAALPGALRADVRLTWSARRWLDDANLFPVGDGRFVDVRLERIFGRLRVRLDGLNVSGNEWEPVGYTLQDFTGEVVPYFFPAAPRAVRVSVEWMF